MTVNAPQPEARDLHRAAHPLPRAAVHDAEPELAVDAPGDDRLVGVGLDAGGEPQEHIGPPPRFPGQRIQEIEVVDIVDDDPSDAGLQGHG